MPHFQGFRCDTCDETIQNDTRDGATDWGGLPDGWLSVMSRVPDLALTFCGWVCAKEYAEDVTNGLRGVRSR